jgi:hypothetical protein
MLENFFLVQTLGIASMHVSDIAAGTPRVSLPADKEGNLV